MEDMHILLHVPGPLPLVYVQSGSGGKDHVGLEEIHPGKSLVALPGKLAFHMLILFPKQRIVRGSSQVEHLLPPLLHLIAQGFENGLVPLAVRKEHKRFPVHIRLLLPAAPGHKADLHQHIPKRVDHHAQDADENGKEHASRTRINV